MKDKHPMPPHLYSKLFQWFCKEDIYNELQGDLDEEFLLNVQERGLRKASGLYRREVVKMLRPSVIKRVKTPSHYHNHTAMFKNYTLVAMRNIARNKLFSSINIIGLAVSMAVGLIAIAFLTEVYSFDTFHSKADRIYRVVNTLYEGNDEPGYYASTSPLTGKMLKEELGDDQVVIIERNFAGDMKKGENTVSIRGILADEQFFNILSFPLVYGNSATALKEPMSIVLTESSAIKLFNNTDVVGETVEWKRGITATITGVMKDPPRNSHMQFDAIGSFSTLELMNRNNPGFMSWVNMWNDHVYLLAPENGDLSRIKASLKRIAEKENARFSNMRIEPELQALSDIFPGEKLFNEVGARMESKTVNTIVILALIVLASACFNYTNLSIARTLKRAREVGVRKSIGAKPGQLLMQFVMEAIVISLLALFFAFLLFQLLKPQFLELNRNIERYVTLGLTINSYLYFLLFAIGIGILAGFLPSFILARLNTVNSLKGAVGIKAGKSWNARKVLTGVQFTLSMAFAIMVTLTYKQYQYILNFDLGFNSENVLNISLQGNDHEIVANSFSQLPEVTGVSFSSHMPSTGGMWVDRGKYIEGNDSTRLYNLHVSTGYVENLEHTLLAGTTFTGTKTNKQVMVNEQFLKRFQIGDPESAIGKTLNIRGRNCKIVGVLEDFHYGTLDNDIEPFVFLGNQREFKLVNLKIASTDISATMAKLEAKWLELDEVHPFRAVFYDERIERAYGEISSSMKTTGLLAIVAISISALGLLGMAVYTTETRQKELTIRKILGANVNHLVLLLSRNFILLFLISAAIAIPVTAYAFKTMVISKLKYTINVGPIELATGAFLVLVIAAITISSQTIKAAKSSPVKQLRSE